MMEHGNFMKSVGVVGERLPQMYPNATPLPLRVSTQDLQVQKIFENVVDRNEPMWARTLTKMTRRSSLQGFFDKQFLNDLANPKEEARRLYLYNKWMKDAGEQLPLLFEHELPQLQADDADNIRFVIAGLKNGDTLLKSKLMLHYVRSRAAESQVDEKTQSFANDNLLWVMLKEIDANQKLSGEYNGKFADRKEAFEFYGLDEFVRPGSAMESALKKRFG